MITGPMTAEDLMNLPDDGMVHELVRGRLRTMTPPGFEHGAIVSRITMRLAMFAEGKDLGCVLTEAGFTIARKPDTVRAPDVSFVRTDRIPPRDQQHRFAELAPDLAVEVVSPSDRSADVREKVDDYLQAGVRLVWVVHPKTRTVDEHRPATPNRTLNEADELSGHDVLPGFSCVVARVFD